MSTFFLPNYPVFLAVNKIVRQFFPYAKQCGIIFWYYLWMCTKLPTLTFKKHYPQNI